MYPDSYVPEGFTPSRAALADLSRAIDRIGDAAKDGTLGRDELQRLKMLHNRLTDALLDAADARVA